MKSFNRWAAGKLSKIKGSEFERLLVSMGAYEKIIVKRIEDGCKSTGGRGIKRVTQLFDFIAVRKYFHEPDLREHNPEAIFFDAKHTKQKYFKHSMIDQSQVNHLMDFWNVGFPAGYVVHFELPNQVVYFTAIQLQEVSRRESLSPEDGVYLGTKTEFKLSRIFDL